MAGLCLLGDGGGWIVKKEFTFRGNVRQHAACYMLVVWNPVKKKLTSWREKGLGKVGMLEIPKITQTPQLISHSIGIILHNVPLKKNARSHDQTTPFWVALTAAYTAYHSNWGNIKPRSQSAPFLNFLVICGSHLSPCAGNNTHQKCIFTAAFTAGAFLHSCFDPN